ncbi:ribonuclease HIII [Halolactibacillus alkaliphilus]|uniref:Ribonuclease HIII n=1 Tax=Halolactibacillus alkaliphilus TaxID=442899 RepID=A0A511X322_9BACI|nr:ribonuclease HIII [Halolactibacillus alkaliphilus]GEN57343.1 ribonuclease HIII [Halolactibacillus alkaliphilus]GGN73021.1 ribonuclease HIII [Halolactibacillus alkaliphilus]SFO92952.1 ribonuclease HIII [Halolactibacillus alkaliphilus]
MGHIIHHVSDDTLKEMTDYYQTYQTKTPQHAAFQAKKNGVTITAYRSKKVMFQGQSPEVEASRWTTDAQQTKTSSQVNTHQYMPDTTLYTKSTIGSDETGTGDYFGPITVCSCYVKDTHIPLLKELGVKDSKNLTDETIKTLAKTILQLDIPYSLVILHNEKYNQLQQKGWSQGKMKTMLHHTAITKLLKKIAPTVPDGIIIDQFATPKVYINHLKTEGKTLPNNSFFVTKAESHAISVACASILARFSFVKEMDKLSEKVGFTLPKGASKKVDQAASYLIKKKGKECLTHYAKVHFKNTEKAAAYLNK